MNEENTEISISVADIALLKQITEIACNRGAFRAEEMSQIGAVYDRVNQWLASIAEKEQETADADSDNAESKETQGDENA